MKTAAQLITQCRAIARNVQNQDGSYSFPDSEILQYLNDAQDTMQNRLSAAKNISKIFVGDVVISLVANQAEYLVPDRVLMNKQIENVEFSASGLITDYVPLSKVGFINRDTYASNYPSSYYRRGNFIVINPPPAATLGSIRVLYERTLDDIAAVTDVVNGTPSGSTFVLTTGYTFVSGDYVNLVDSLGNVLLRNGLVSSYNGGTKTVTLSAAVSTYLTTYGAARLVAVGTLSFLAGASVIYGIYSTHISQLPDSCETYLIHSAAADIFGKDNAQTDFIRERGKADAAMDEILAAFKAQTSEIQTIPQFNSGDWW
jgi:hypothetical protein